jgi:hypothetical protein
MFYNFLTDRILISLTGNDVAKFLQGVITNDINKVSDDTAIYSCILTPQGRYLYDFFILKDNNVYIIDCLKSQTDGLLQKLQMYKLRSDVTIATLPDYNVYGLRDVHSSYGFSKELGCKGKIENYIVYNDPRSIYMPGRIYLPIGEFEDFAARHHLVKDAVCYDEIRIRTGVAEGDKDLIQNKSFPLEYGFEQLNAIDFDKGCYVGQEVTTRTKRQGVIRKNIFFVTSNVKLPTLGTDITINGVKIGTMCSSYNDIGLALIKTEDYENVCLLYQDAIPQAGEAKLKLSVLKGIMS